MRHKRESMDAFTKYRQGKLGPDQTLVLQVFRNAGADGLTREEAWKSSGFGWRWNVFSPRVTELRDMELLVETGRHRLTEAGNNAMVLVHFECKARVFSTKGD